jgi:hypothetical protein
MTSISTSSKASSRISPHSEKKSTVRMKTEKKSVICENCIKHLQNEAKLVESLRNLNGFVNSCVLNVNEWKKGRISRISESFFDVFSEENSEMLESMKKVKELAKGINEIHKIILGFVEEVKVLAKVKEIQIAQENQDDKGEGILAAIAKMKVSVLELKKQMVNANRPPLPVDDVSKCLYAQLMHEKREKKALENIIKENKKL